MKRLKDILNMANRRVGRAARQRQTISYCTEVIKLVGGSITNN